MKSIHASLRSSTAIAITTFAFLLCMAGCGDDDANGNAGSGSASGEGSFDISGDFEEHMSGWAHFDDDYPLDGYWRISIGLDWEWELNFTQDSGRPDPGTYELGNFSSAAAGDFGVAFHHADSQPDVYSPGAGETVGTIEITESSEDLVEGTFEATLHRSNEDGAVDGHVEITDGTFSAVQRQED